MTETMIEATDIGMALGEGAARVDALKGVTLSLAGGELTLLMGPSGSGKTTLLSVLGCMLSPTSGNVRIRGRSTSGLTAEQLAQVRREHVGFVFQSYHLFPTLSAAQNVQLALDIRRERGRRARKKAREALDMVGLAHKVKTRPGELSGGEQQRVAIARALVANPSIVLADEPTSSLDSDNGRTIMRLLAEAAHERGQAVLVVTHDPRILPFADRIVHIEDGLIVDRPTGEAEVLRLPTPAPFPPRAAAGNES